MWNFETAEAFSDTEVVVAVPWGGENFGQVILSFGCSAEFNQLCIKGLQMQRPFGFDYRYLIILNIGTKLWQQAKHQTGAPRASKEDK